MTIKNEQNKETESKRKTKISKKEIIMIVMFILFLGLLTYKSVVFDEVKNLNSDEQKFKDFVDYSVSQDHDGFLENSGLMEYRVYDLKVADEKQHGILRYIDPVTGQEVEVIQECRYEANVRGYLFQILPIDHFAITAKIK